MLNDWQGVIFFKCFPFLSPNISGGCCQRVFVSSDLITLFLKISGL
uniref:Uncharacterized protein n=1 Tax=Anguilla anguilla TaxID=7936 RepID=A0A0E9USB3_ANGAN